VTTRRLALAGLVGPPVFAVVVILLTALEWDFLHDLGWSAGLFDSPDTPWPSSTALGDYGFLQVLNFLLLGLSVLALSVALFRLLDVRRKVGPSLLALLGVGFVGSAIRTDDKNAHGGGPDTWNGAVHAAAFTVIVFAAIASVFVLAAQFRRDERWRPMSRPSLIAGLVALASLVANLAGGGNLFFYTFIVVLLAWLSLLAAYALRLARSAAL
jgi:hypothetical protein